MKKLKSKTTSLIIAILLHLLLLLLFTFYAFRERIKFVIIPTEKAKKRFAKIQEQIQQRKQAFLMPKKSDEGTLVFFDSQKAIQEDHTEKLKKTDEDIQAKVSEKIKLEEKKDTIAKKEKPKENIIPKQIDIKEKLVKHEETKVSEIGETKLKEIKKIEEEPELAESKFEEKLNLKKLALANLLKNKSKQKENLEKISAGSKEEKQEKSILKLTKCHLDSKDGNSCMIRFGENKFADLEEMKFICYEKQIEDNIISSWKIMLTMGIPQFSTPNPASIKFSIQENGELNELFLIRSSGDATFDKLAIQCIRRASPFPPIPKHFGMKIYHPRGGLTIL